MSEALAVKGGSRRVTAHGPLKAQTLPRRETMNSLAKGLSVIRVFSRDRNALRLCDVAKLTGMPAASARRCLMALEQLGYVVRQGSLFHLRPKVLELTAAYVESMNLEALTAKPLQSMTESTGDSAGVCVLDGAEIVYVAHAEIRTRVQLEVHVGSRFPADTTSAGRILLAEISPEALNRFMQGPHLSQNALRRPRAPDLMKVIHKCQRNGYASTADELGCGIVSVAVAIRDQQGRAVAALSSSSQSSRISAPQLVRERLGLLQAVSRQITQALSSAHSLSFATGP